MNRKVVIALISVAVIAVCGGIAAGGLSYFIITNATKIEGVQIINSQLAGMPKLQSKLMEAYPSDSIEIQVAGGRMLSIDMINSGIANLSETERQAKAKEIAIFAMKNYSAINTIDTIVITFTEKTVIVLEFSKTMTYEYYTQDLR